MKLRVIRHYQRRGNFYPDDLYVRFFILRAEEWRPWQQSVLNGRSRTFWTNEHEVWIIPPNWTEADVSTLKRGNPHKELLELDLPEKFVESLPPL